MANAKLIQKQLKKIGFNFHGWGRTEINELEHILLEDEEIYECVNGIYEGGFALLLATDIRVLLVDKKPLNYLSVEDMRYELISEIDYNHRLIGAYVSISSGSKNLKFNSLNQHRLRKLITLVQNCMAETKKKQSSHQEDQNQHLEQINQQLQSYLVAQHEQQKQLQEQLQRAWQSNATVPAELPQQAQPLKPSPQLADYLFAQRLLEDHQAQTGQSVELTPRAPAVPAVPIVPAPASPADDLYAEGRKEVFAQGSRHLTPSLPTAQLKHLSEQAVAGVQAHNPLSSELNPLRIAYSKLPMALRNRKFGRPLFHAHSQEAVSATGPTEV
jgi:hypothetical protein